MNTHRFQFNPLQPEPDRYRGMAGGGSSLPVKDAIQPIETEYSGIRFRSRLEARWAVFFDALGVRYRYELEGFRLAPPDYEIDDNQGLNAWSLETISYLPDFLIPSQPKFPKAIWIEVKGELTKEDEVKMNRLVCHSGVRGVIVGNIPWWPGNRELFDWIREEGFTITTPYVDDNGLDRVGWDHPYVFCECPFCASFGFEFDGRSARIGCGCAEHAGVANGDKTYNAESPDIMAAYAAARRERFGT